MAWNADFIGQQKQQKVPTRHVITGRGRCCGRCAVGFFKWSFQVDGLRHWYLQWQRDFLLTLRRKSLHECKLTEGYENVVWISSNWTEVDTSVCFFGFPLHVVIQIKTNTFKFLLSSLISLIVILRGQTFISSTHPFYIFKMGCVFLGTSIPTKRIYTHTSLSKFTDQRAKGIMRTSGEIDFRFHHIPAKALDVPLPPYF